MSADFIPYGHQDISDADVQAVVEVLRSDWLTQGPSGPRFESAVAERCGARHGIAVANATAALHLACLALGLGPGGRLWTSPNTFVASANCALYCGADVDFVDIDPGTLNMSADALGEKLVKAEKTGTLPDIVVPVHFAGQPCEMDRIAELSRRYGFAVVEDASHAVGATFRGERVGSGRWSDITVFSFHPVKIMTTAEGGLLLTNRDEVAYRLRLLRSHGISRDQSDIFDKTQGAWYYEQLDLGLNYRLTDLQAVLGLSQLQRLDAFLESRRKIVDRYEDRLSSLPLGLQRQHAAAESAWHLFVVRVLETSGRTRRQVFDALRSADIGVNVHYIPVHLQPYYRRLGFKSGDFPQAERYYSQALSLPIYSGLSGAAQDRVIKQLAAVLGM